MAVGEPKNFSPVASPRLAAFSATRKDITKVKIKKKDLNDFIHQLKRPSIENLGVAFSQPTIL